VLPWIPFPYSSGCHFDCPDFRMRSSPSLIFRARLIIRPMVSSLVGAVSRSGTFDTHMPRRVQASRSKLSWPLRAAAIIRNLGACNNQESSILSGMKARRASVAFTSLQSRGFVNRCWGVGAYAFPMFSSPAKVSGETRWLATIVLEEACVVMQSSPFYKSMSAMHYRKGGSGFAPPLFRSAVRMPSGYAPQSHLRNPPIFAKANVYRVGNHDHAPCDQHIGHHLGIEEELLRIKESFANSAGADHAHNRRYAHVPFKTKKSMDSHRRKCERQHRKTGD